MWREHPENILPSALLIWQVLLMGNWNDLIHYINHMHISNKCFLAGDYLQIAHRVALLVSKYGREMLKNIIEWAWWWLRKHFFLTIKCTSSCRLVIMIISRTNSLTVCLFSQLKWKACLYYLCNYWLTNSKIPCSMEIYFINQFTL